MELDEYQVGEFAQEECEYCGALLFKGEEFRCCDFGQVLFLRHIINYL